jgi:hypothetical protein
LVAEVLPGEDDRSLRLQQFGVSGTAAATSGAGTRVEVAPECAYALRIGHEAPGDRRGLAEKV